MLKTLITTIPIIITFIAIIIKITIIKVTIMKLTIIKIAIIPIIIIIIIIITISTKRHVAPSNISDLTSWTSSRAQPSQSKTVSQTLRSSPTKGNPAQKTIAGWTKVMTMGLLLEVKPWNQNVWYLHFTHSLWKLRHASANKSLNPGSETNQISRLPRLPEWIFQII